MKNNVKILFQITVAVLITVPVITAGDSVYYITPDDGSGECPTSDNCHTLTHYVDNDSFSHTINATFVLMEGQHQLGTDVTIDSAHNITIMAFDSQSSSNPIITCNSPVGLWFSNSTSITITNIVINSCSNHGNTLGALTFSNISGTLALDSITVTNSSSRGVIMNKVEMVDIQKCIFKSNGNGGIEMVDVQEILIEGCSFTDNTAKYGGGLKIKASSSTCPILSLIHSNFTNNTALYGGGLLIDVQCGSMTVSNSHFSYNTVQRLGGGVRVRVSNGTYHPNFTFIQSTFEYNTVLGKDVLPGEPPAGGGVYMYLTEIKPTITIIVTECTFNSNNGHYYGGGLAINRNDTHIRAKSSTFLINTIIKYSLFQFNNALETSGIYINFLNSNTTILGSKFFNNSCTYKRCYSSRAVIMFQHTKPMTQWPSDATISDCAFLDNDQIGLRSYFFIPSLKIRNVTFHGQVTAMFIFLNADSTIENITVTSSSSSAIVINCNSLASITLSDLKIHNNQGTGIAITNCHKIIFRGNNTIANNTASLDGGGMAIYGKGPFVIAPHATVLFSNNTAGRSGGGVYVKEKSSKLLLNLHSQCTIQETSANRIYFELNKAVVAGDDFYGGKFFYCMNNKHNYYTPKRNNTVIALPENVPKSWNQPSSRSSKPFSVISSDPIAVCLCENDTVYCSKMSTINKQMYSGESFNVSIAVVGLGGGVNSGSFITTISSGLELISDANDNFIANKSCKTFVYTPKLTHPTNYQFNTNATLNISNSLIPDGYLNISLTMLPCPPGLVLDTVTRSCVCDSALTQKVPGIRCNVSWMPHPIEYSKNNWIGYYKPLNCTIAHSGCPFDYCVSSTAKFSLNESDLQCNYNRSGILCGQCRPGLSLMLGSNKCSQCSNDWLALVPVFAISGVLLVVILIALNLTVSVGSINGLLFYANIVKLNESVFFPRGNIPIISQFIAWLNLDWGIETCFYNGLEGYWKVMLQFVFPVYLWFLVIAIIIACRYSFRVSRLCGHNAVPVLATLILMSYTKALRTVTKSLMINAIECGDARWKVWNVDGNIPYLSSKHVVLFGISLLFLFTGLVYTGLVFSSQWLQRYSGKCCKSTRDPVVKLKPLIDAYTGPYKDRYRFWTGLGLIVRILLTVTFTLTSESMHVVNNFFVSITILLAIPLGCRVYCNKYNTIAEIYSHINLFFLASTTTVSIDDGSTFISTTTLTEISITFEMLLFLSIIGVQCYTRGKDLFKKRRQVDSSRYSQRNYGSFFNDDLPMDNHTQQREPLIFENN